MRQRAVLAGIAGAAAVVLAAPAALAVTEGPYSQTVSCDATITDTLKTFFHASTGKLSFQKVGDTNGNFNQAVNAMSTSGNYVGWKTVTGTGTVSWDPVLSSSYTFKIRPSTSRDCNGSWLPGDGNTTLTYKVTHN